MTSDQYKRLCDALPSSLKMRLDNIKIYLNYKRDEHSQSSASLMVGAGFSKNADKGTDVSMLDWNELGKKFFAKLYGHEPSAQDLMFDSPIKLATMVEAEFGHTILDKMIQDSLPDNNVFPNDLYKDLLNLPWHDVFTTNYDRLLEKTRVVDGMKRQYHVVTNKETLIYTPSPRIVKLHGSFPNIHPYIITEEDYRTYPVKYPEFVNTVRQALIENLFCLIGFSGDDPNFLNWIGWLRDVMGRLSMPVYMIVFDNNVHAAQAKLLQERHIELVNLADIKGINSYREAFEFLFRYLGEKIQRTWNCNLDYKLDSEKDIRETIANAAFIRKSYPGWIVLPEKYYDFFEDDNYVSEIIRFVKSTKDDTLKLNLLYEFDWRLQLSLTPAYCSTYVSELENIIIGEKDSKETRNKKLWLKLSLLNCYRHCAETDKYQTLADKIGVLLKESTDEVLKRRYYNELSLSFLSVLKYDKCLKLIKDWHPVKTDFKSRIQKATILDECGNEKEAVEELKNTRSDIRNQRLTDDNSSSPLWDSCLLQIYRLLGVYSFSYPSEEDDKEYKNGFISFETFVDKLKKQHEPPFTIVHNFDVNSYTSRWTVDGDGYPSGYLNAYRVLTWMEESGYTFGSYRVTTEHEAMRLSISKLIIYEPLYGAKALVRTCNKKLIAEVLTRQTLNAISCKNIDKIFDVFLPLVEDIPTKGNISKVERQWLCVSMLAYMATKASENNVSQLLKSITAHINTSLYFIDARELKIVFDCSSLADKETVTNKLFSAPFPKSDSNEVKLSFLQNDSKVSIHKDTLNFLINGLKDKDENTYTKAYNRIAKLYNFLSVNDKNYLCEAVIEWRNTGKKTSAKIRSYGLFVCDEKEIAQISKDANHEIDCFDITKYKTDGSSSIPITSINAYLSKIGPIVPYADKQHIESLINTICDYLVQSKVVFEKDDRWDFFDGIRYHADRMMGTACRIFVQKDVAAKYSSDTAHRLYNILIEYCAQGFHIFHPTAIIAKQIKNLNEFLPFVIKPLFSGQIDGIYDLLRALKIVMGDSFSKELMNKIESYIEFGNSADVAAYISFLSDLIEEGIYPLNSSTEGEHRDIQLNTLLQNVAQKAKSAYEAPVMVDVEYEMLRLVRHLEDISAEWKSSKGGVAWKAINEDPETFNDVRVR